MRRSGRSRREGGWRLESCAVTREAWGGAGTPRGQRGAAGRSWSRTALETARARPPRSFLTFSRPVHLPPPPIHRGPSRGPITAVWQIAARAVCASHSCLCPAPPFLDQLAFLVHVFHLFWPLVLSFRSASFAAIIGRSSSNDSSHGVGNCAFPAGAYTTGVSGGQGYRLEGPYPWRCTPVVWLDEQLQHVVRIRPDIIP